MSTNLCPRCATVCWCSPESAWDAEGGFDDDSWDSTDEMIGRALLADSDAVDLRRGRGRGRHRRRDRVASFLGSRRR